PSAGRLKFRRAGRGDQGRPKPTSERDFVRRRLSLRRVTAALDVIGGCGSSGRNDRNNFHVVGADDYNLVFIDEVKEAAPPGLDPHKRLWHRDDMNSLPRNYRSDSDVEVDVTDPRRAMRIDDSSADLGALLLVKLHGHAGG